MTAPLIRPASSSTQRANTVNPVRIGRIGTDTIQVFIRPAFSDAELAALVERMDQLVAAGFKTIDVVFEDTSEQGAGTRISTTERVAA